MLYFIDGAIIESRSTDVGSVTAGDRDTATKCMQLYFLVEDWLLPGQYQYSVIEALFMRNSHCCCQCLIALFVGFVAISHIES